MVNQMDMGLMVEGVVELDPLSGRLIIRVEDKQGGFETYDLQEHLARYNGREVRCIVTPMATVAKLAQMVEQGRVRLEDVPSVPKLG